MDIFKKGNGFTEVELQKINKKINEIKNCLSVKMNIIGKHLEQLTKRKEKNPSYEK